MTLTYLLESRIGTDGKKYVYPLSGFTRYMHGLGDCVIITLVIDEKRTCGFDMMPVGDQENVCDVAFSDKLERWLLPSYS